MAKTVAVLTAQETRLLERAHTALGEFLQAQRPKPLAQGAAPALRRKRSHKAKPVTGLTKAGKPRKPTGAAAHKANLAAKAAAEEKPKEYPPVMFDLQQQETLAEMKAAPVAD